MGRQYFKGKGRAWSHPSVIALLGLAQKGETPDDIIKQMARDLVKEALNDGWSGPPFDPMILASLKGIKVEPTTEDFGADARVFAECGGTVRIQYNSERPQTRINFSICHELVHTFFPDCYEHARYRNAPRRDDPDWELECLCDLGASELLMPQEHFQKNLKEAGTSLEASIFLREKYKASNEAVLIRLAQLSDSPCAAVFFSEKLKPKEIKDSQTQEFDFAMEPIHPKLRVDYVKPSQNFAVFIPHDKSAPADSVVNQCLAYSEIREGMERWEISGFGTWRVQAAELPRSKTSNSRRVVALVFPSN